MKKSNNYSKFVATAATATLVATAVVPAASAQEMKFTDVGDRYADAVNYLVENNITQGLTETKFGTQSNIKRVDVAVLIAKATLTEDEITNAPASTFGDVPARATKYVSALKAKGIINGKTAASFGSDLSITRGEAAIMLSKAYEIEGDTANVKFGDVGTRYKDAVAALVDNKITTGKTDSSFGTALSITRGELAIFLHRLETLDATPAPEPEYKVDSVEAISGTQVQVKFTEAVNPATLFANGKMGEFKEGVFTMSTVGDANPTGDVSGMLAEDGKTLTVTTEKATAGRYTVIIDGLKTTGNKEIEKFEQVVTIAKDEKSPTLVKTSQVNASQYMLKFSEPMGKIGTIQYTDENGAVYSQTVDNSFETGDTEVLFNLPADLKADKKLNVRITGAEDVAGNVIAPNPVTTTFTKGDKDGVAPTVGTIEQTGAKQFSIMFSESLAAAPTVTVADFDVESVKVDSSNPLKYVVTTKEALKGKKEVTISNMKDMSGEMGEVTSKEVTFTKDEVAPKVTASKVVVGEDGKKEYLELTMDKKVNVTSASTVTAKGEYTRKDGVSQVINNTVPVTASADDSTKLRVELSKLLANNDYEGVNYDLALTLNGVVSDADIAATAGNIKFTRGTDTPEENTNDLTVKSFEQQSSNPSQIKVVFDKKVDGASAKTLANYVITGATVKDVKLSDFVDGVGQTATLTVEAGSIATTADRYVTVKNIKAEGSTKVMTPYTTTINLVENVAPTVDTAKLVNSSTIELTFLEAVKSGTLADFDVLADGKTVAAGVNAKVDKDDNKKVTITLNPELTVAQLAKAITLKPVSSIDLTDVNNNKLMTTGAIELTR